MSPHLSNSTPKATTKVLAAVAGSVASVCLSLAAAAGPAAAIQLPDPVPRLVTATAVPNQGPPDYPAYAPQYEIPRAAEHDVDLGASSIALGALGGVVIAGVGLGISVGVQRRRDDTSPTAPEAPTSRMLTRPTR
jgi:hypothetical protein